MSQNSSSSKGSSRLRPEFLPSMAHPFDLASRSSGLARCETRLSFVALFGNSPRITRLSGATKGVVWKTAERKKVWERFRARVGGRTSFRKRGRPSRRSVRKQKGEGKRCYF